MTTQRLNAQFGNYRLLSLLGQGGFSEVYLGEHIYLKTRAAIKILTARLEQDELARFLSEARIIASLEHPHIARVLDFGREGQTPFLVLSYAPHGSMRQRYPAGSVLPLAEVVDCTRQVAGAQDSRERAGARTSRRGDAAQKLRPAPHGHEAQR